MINYGYFMIIMYDMTCYDNTGLFPSGVFICRSETVLAITNPSYRHMKISILNLNPV